MRDPARIDKILAQIKRIWVAHPDMRLGQLLCNYSGRAANRIELSDFEANPFFYEDDALLASLESVDLSPHPAQKARDDNEAP